jgi:hypothetical protein
MENEVKELKFLNMFFSEKTVLIIGGGCVFAYVISIIAFTYFSFDEEKVGQFGNFVGGAIGTILIVASVILYYMALKEQRKDIKVNQEALKLQIKALEQQITEFKAQRKELEQTRNVYEEQTKIYKQQMQTMKIKQFESNFYSYLNVYLRIKSELNENNNRNFAKKICNDIVFDDCLRKANITECHDIVNAKYHKVYSLSRSDVSRYFKTIFHLINIIDNSNLNIEEKIAYANTFKSQMEDYELLILYYYCHSFYGNQSQNLTLKYNLLEHLHPLAKFEFKDKYDLNEQMGLYIFIDELSRLIDRNIYSASSLENTEPTKESKEYSPYEIMLSINIDMEFKFEIQYKHTENTKCPFQEKFGNFIAHFLYDKFYYSKFIIPINDDEIKLSTIISGNKTTFSYIKEIK